MKNPTIKEIAIEAGVSISTVSNVLNNKQNMKIETIRRVEQAITKLGYIRNDNASSITKKSSNYIGIVIDRINSFTAPIIGDLIHIFSKETYELKIIETYDKNPSDIINKLNNSNLNSIVFTNNTKHFAYSIKDGINKIILGFKEDIFKAHISFNLDSLYENIYDDNFIIYSDGDSLALGKTIADFKNLPYLNDLNELTRLAFSSEINIVIFDPLLIDKLSEYCLIKQISLNKIYLVSTISLSSFHYQKIKLFNFSSNELALKILNIIKNINSTIISNTKVFINEYSLKEYDLKKTVLKLLMLKNPFSLKLKELIPLFKKYCGIELKIDLKSFSEIEEICHSEKIHNYDLVRLDMNSFQFYAKDFLMPLNDFPNITRLANRFKDWHRYSYLNNELYALPLDPSLQILAYRKDIFENAIIKKILNKNLNINSLANLNYTDYLNLAKNYREINVPEKTISEFTALSFLNPLLLASEFLPYFISNGGKVSLKDEKLILSEEAFIKTLDLYRELLDLSLISNSNWWDEEIKLFNESKTACLIAYTSQLANVNIQNVDYAFIPGNKPFMGGGCIAAIKSSKKIDAIITFLDCLYQYPILLHFAKSGICTAYSSMYYNKLVYEKFPYLSFSNNALNYAERINSINNNIKINTIYFEELLGSIIIEGVKNNLDSKMIYNLAIKKINETNNYHKLIKDSVN